MTRCSETHADDDFDSTMRSEGRTTSCFAAVRLPRAKSINLGLTTWWHTNFKHQKTTTPPNSTAAPRASLLEAQSSKTGKKAAKVRGEKITLPTLTADDAWYVMRDRYLVRTGSPASPPLSCDGVSFSPTQLDPPAPILASVPQGRLWLF